MFYLVKKLFRFLSFSGKQRNQTLEAGLAGVWACKKVFFQPPTTNLFALVQKLPFFNKGSLRLLSADFVDRCGLAPWLTVCSRSYARHPCGYGGISPLTLHSASRSLPYGKSTIKPSQRLFIFIHYLARVLYIAKP